MTEDEARKIAQINAGFYAQEPIDVAGLPFIVTEMSHSDEELFVGIRLVVVAKFWKG